MAFLKNLLYALFQRERAWQSWFRSPLPLPSPPANMWDNCGIFYGVAFEKNLYSKVCGDV